MLLLLILDAARAATFTVDGTSYISISDAVADASSGDTIVIAAGVWYDCVDLDGKSLTLSGAGSGSTVLDAAGVCDVALAMDSRESSVEVSGLSIRNAGKTGIRVDVGDVTFDDVFVRRVGVSSRAEVAGVDLLGGTLTWTGGGLDDAAASGCGGLHVRSGADAQVEDLVVTATRRPLCVEADARITVLRSDFDGFYRAVTLDPGATAHSEGNTYHDGGSGIVAESAIELVSIDDAFLDNGGGIGVAGNGLDPASSVQVRGSRFLRNAGAALVGETRAEVVVADATFDSNGGTNVGALVVSSNVSTLELSNCTFTNNTSQAPGGAVRTRARLTDRGSTFRNNASTREDGGAVYSQASVELVGTLFEANTTTRRGAGVYWDPLDFEPHTFSATDCTVADHSKGEAIYLLQGGTIDGCTFSRNTDTPVVSWGADPTVRRVGLKLGGQTPPGCDRTT